MKFDLKHLEAFVAAAKCGSFTRAAASLNVSQPTFTVQIRQLEEALGARLLDRNTRSVRLTPIGEQLAGPLERALNEIESIFLNIDAISGKTKGTVAIATYPAFFAILLPQAISEFHSQHSGISIRLKDGLGNRIASMVRTGDVDFGLGSRRTNEPDVDFETLFADPMCAVFPRGSPLQKKGSVSLAELAAFPLILLDDDSSIWADVIRGLAAVKIYHGPVAQPAFIISALGMVKANLGVAILPASVLQAEDRRLLNWRPIKNPQLEREVGVFRRRGRTLSPAAELFLTTIRAACESFGAQLKH